MRRRQVYHLRISKIINVIFSNINIWEKIQNFSENGILLSELLEPNAIDNMGMPMIKKEEERSNQKNLKRR